MYTYLHTYIFVLVKEGCGLFSNTCAILSKIDHTLKLKKKKSQQIKKFKSYRPLYTC